MKSNLALWLAFPDILFSAPIFSSAAFFLGFLTAWILALPFQAEVIPREAFLCPNRLSFIWGPARWVGGGAGQKRPPCRWPSYVLHPPARAVFLAQETTFPGGQKLGQA